MKAKRYSSSFLHELVTKRASHACLELLPPCFHHLVLHFSLSFSLYIVFNNESCIRENSYSIFGLVGENKRYRSVDWNRIVMDFKLKLEYGFGFFARNLRGFYLDFGEKDSGGQIGWRFAKARQEEFSSFNERAEHEAQRKDLHTCVRACNVQSSDTVLPKMFYNIRENGNKSERTADRRNGVV